MTEELEAGPELDALVAEKVMGLPVYRDMDNGFPHLGVKGSYGPIPDYSVLIEDAWQVVEKLSNKYRVQVAQCFFPDVLWLCELWDYAAGRWEKEESEDAEFCAYGKTAPYAICRAALKAVEVTK
jgi:hypothetical protein